MPDVLPPRVAPDRASRASLPRARVPAAEAPRGEGTLGLLVAVVVVAALYLGRDVLVPITLAVLLSFLLAPLVNLLRRLHLPRVVAVLASVATALGVILTISTLIGTQIASLATDLPTYQTTITRKVDAVRNFSNTEMAALTRRLSRPVHSAPPPAAVRGPGEQKVVPVEVQEPTPTPLALVQRFLAPILSPIETIGVVFVVAIFILMQQDDLRDRLIRLFGSNDLHRTTLALDDAASRLSRYFLTQLGVNTAFGVIVAVGLFFLGVPSPVLWGVLGTLLRFVPYVGSLIAGVLPVALAAAVDPGWSLSIETAALFLVVEGLMGQVVEPMLYGHSTGLSPVAVIVVAIFWSWIWGPIGLILSTPLTLCLVVLGRHVDRLEFLDVLLGDRPALTPIENFYQRTLAGDEDEILHQAEILLRARPLSSYYDDVALKGLQLAAADVQRGVLSLTEVAEINTAIQELIGNLEGHDDVAHAASEHAEVAGMLRDDRRVATSAASSAAAAGQDELPAAWRGAGAVLCVAGRGPLDEAAAAMMAQLLRKHGLGARVMPNRSVSRTEVDTLDVHGVAMICLSYLDIGGTQTSLRYLVRRLRARAPGVPILLGLWPAEDELMSDPTLQAQIGAEYYVTSLSEAVTACVQASRPVENVA